MIKKVVLYGMIDPTAKTDKDDEHYFHVLYVGPDNDTDFYADPPLIVKESWLEEA